MASNARYITYPITADSRDLMQRAFAYLQAKMPGWVPSEGNLETWMIEAVGGEAGDIATLTTEVPKGIFRYFGARLFGIEAIDATRATVDSTWFSVDSAQHVIQAGTQVGILDGAGNVVPFEVLVDVTIPTGSTQSGVGGVVLVAVIAGASGEDIGSVGGAVSLLDTFAWVDHITMTTATTGGQDAETDDEYLDRLARTLQTISPTPILPNDFAILARNVAGVQRATCIDGYNPTGPTTGNEREVCIVAVDSAGLGVSSGIKTAISAYLESLRELNFIVNTTDPTSHQVDVDVTVLAEVGYDTEDVRVRVTSAITAFLNPAVWGISHFDNPNQPATWNNVTKVYYIDLGTAIKEVSGVSRVEALTLGPHSGSLVAADYTMSGIVPLPAVGTLTVAVDAP